MKNNSFFSKRDMFALIQLQKKLLERQQHMSLGFKGVEKAFDTVPR